jgi:hypothetical protein
MEEIFGNENYHQLYYIAACSIIDDISLQGEERGQFIAIVHGTQVDYIVARLNNLSKGATILKYLIYWFIAFL